MAFELSEKEQARYMQISESFCAKFFFGAGKACKAGAWVAKNSADLAASGLRKAADATEDGGTFVAGKLMEAGEACEEKSREHAENAEFMARLVKEDSDTKQGEVVEAEVIDAA